MKKILLKNYTEELEHEYKNYRNKVTALIKKTKNDFYKNKINDAEGNYKKIWETINDITNSKPKKPSGTANSISVNGITITDEKGKANEFNNFFVNLGENMAKQIQKTELPINFLNDTRIDQTIFLEPINKEELITYISKLKNNCSPGPDQITSKTIKHIHIHLVQPLTYIINLCFTFGKIPKQWKESIITPIFKTEDPSKVDNYRPISIINNFSKIFEQSLKSRIIGFLNKHNVITDRQFGFIKKSNTENALIDLLRTTTRALDNSSKCIAVFLDLAKAFDTVEHNILINKLTNYGIRGVALELMKNYLTDRPQKVKIGNTFSSNNIVKTGVPQGTVMGPILFLIYMNSITKINNFSGHLVCYADDTALIFSEKSWKQVKQNAETSLRKLYMWLNNNLLTLNIKKTKYITFSPTIVDQPNNLEHLKLHNGHCSQPNNCKCNQLDETKFIKYLGVIVDQHLKWTEHITYVAKRIRVLMHKFYELREILSKKHLTLLYNSLVESIIRYCITAWGGTYRTTLSILQTAQNMLLKVIFKKVRMFPTDSLYKETKILNIQAMYANQCLLRLFNDQQKTPVTYTGNRSATNLKVRTEVFKKSVTKNSFFYYATRLYNHLPTELKQIKIYKKYKILIKSYLINHPDILDILT